MTWHREGLDDGGLISMVLQQPLCDLDSAVLIHPQSLSATKDLKTCWYIKQECMSVSQEIAAHEGRTPPHSHNPSSR